MVARLQKIISDIQSLITYNTLIMVVYFPASSFNASVLLNTNCFVSK